MVNIRIKDLKVCRTQIFKAPTVQYIKGKRGSQGFERFLDTAVCELKLYQEIVDRVQAAAILVSSVGGSQGQPGPPIISSQSSLHQSSWRPPCR